MKCGSARQRNVLYLAIRSASRREVGNFTHCAEFAPVITATYRMVDGGHTYGVFMSKPRRFCAEFKGGVAEQPAGRQLRPGGAGAWEPGQPADPPEAGSLESRGKVTLDGTAVPPGEELAQLSAS